GREPSTQSVRPLVAGQPHQRHLDQTPVETRGRRLPDPRMPGRRIRQHRRADPISLQRRERPAGGEGRRRGNLHPRQRRAAALAHAASQRAAAKPTGTMTRTSLTVPLLLLLAAPLAMEAQEANPPSRRDYSAFRIIAERNNFNPNRSGRSGRSAARAASEGRVATPSFALVGTMCYEQGRFAFFDGSSSDYRKALEPADSIAGYKIAAITPGHVKLESTNGQPIDLAVGMQMKKQDEGDWLLVAGTESSKSVGHSSASAGSLDPSLAKDDKTETAEATEADPAGPADEVLKK